MTHDNDDFSFPFDSDWEDDGYEFESEFGLSSELEEAERQIRIQKLREEIEQRGGAWQMPQPGEVSPETEEALLDRVLFLDKAPRTTMSRQLIGDGVYLPAPDSLADGAEIHNKLWEVIHGLARLRVFLYCTNHLSDRQLYARLWYETLNQDTVDISWDPESACHMDLIGSGGEEDTRVWLSYFADDEERQWWLNTIAENGEELPPRCKPPFDRDRLLPKREHY